MKKRLAVIFFALMLAVATAFLAFADDRLPRLVDTAGLLSDSEKTYLLEKLDEISERQEVDIVVVTTESLEEKSAMEYADDFYDYNGYGFGSEKDGILFLISTEEREWHISTTGYGITAITDTRLRSMSNEFIYDLSEGNYASAFTTFAEQCDSFITQARNSEKYNVNNNVKKSDNNATPRTPVKEPFLFSRNFMISLGIGFVLSLIVTGIMRSQLKTVHSQSKADDYIKKGSMNLTRRNDLFLYSHVDKRKKPEEPPKNSSDFSTTHTSSSGTTHGGGGGKF